MTPQSHPEPIDDFAGAPSPGSMAPRASSPPVDRITVPLGSRRRHGLARRGMGLAVMSAGATALLLGFQSPGFGAAPASVAAVDASPSASAALDPCAVVAASASPGASLDALMSPAASAVPCVPVTGPGASAAASALVAVEQVLVGQAIQTRYGNVQVQITVNGTQITDVQALQLPYDRHDSAQISDYVAPYLRQMALQAQSANIDVISGATYTSQAYAASLQSAIDQITTTAQ